MLGYVLDHLAELKMPRSDTEKLRASRIAVNENEKIQEEGFRPQKMKFFPRIQLFPDMIQHMQDGLIHSCSKCIFGAENVFLVMIIKKGFVEFQLFFLEKSFVKHDVEIADAALSGEFMCIQFPDHIEITGHHRIMEPVDGTPADTGGDIHELNAVMAVDPLVKRILLETHIKRQFRCTIVSEIVSTHFPLLRQQSNSLTISCWRISFNFQIRENIGILP